jgi:hypothetical protein
MRRKALDLLSRFSYINQPVKVRKRHRGIGGQVVTLRDVFWHKEEPWGVVQLPSGTRTAIPLAWTDIPKKVFPSRMTTPQIDAIRLLEMSRLCQQLSSRPARPSKRKRWRKSVKAK